MLMQLGPRDQISLALRESREHAQRLFLDWDADAVFAQLTQRGIYLKRSELENRTGLHGTHSSSGKLR